MHVASLDEIKTLMDAAINDKLCVQTWLGYASVLFIGFGGKVLEYSRGELHPIPPYEIETGYADWWVEDNNGIIGRSTDERLRAENAASILIGHKVLMWRFVGNSVAIRIEFDGGYKLEIAPYPDTDISEEDAWCLRTVQQCIVVKWNGNAEVEDIGN